MCLRLQPHVLEAATGARVKVELRELKGGGHGVERVKEQRHVRAFRAARQGRYGQRHATGIKGSATCGLSGRPPPKRAAGPSAEEGPPPSPCGTRATPIWCAGSDRQSVSRCVGKDVRKEGSEHGCGVGPC
jgi:hypothetical protein